MDGTKFFFMSLKFQKRSSIKREADQDTNTPRNHGEYIKILAPLNVCLGVHVFPLKNVSL